MSLGRNLLTFATLALTFPLNAVAEDTSVAKMLGVKSAAVANAVEDGASRTPFGEDELAQKMEREASRFLNRSRSPVSYDPAEAAQYRVGASARPRRLRQVTQEDLEAKQQEALELLEFRRNVEDAMSKILSFQPTVERNVPPGEAEWGAQPGPVPSPEDGWDYPAGGDPRERLLAAVEDRDTSYAPARPVPRQVLEIPQYREPELEQTLLYNQRARGTEPQAAHGEGHRRIRVINDDSRQSRRTAGGVIRLGR